MIDDLEEITFEAAGDMLKTKDKEYHRRTVSFEDSVDGSIKKERSDVIMICGDSEISIKIGNELPSIEVSKYAIVSLGLILEQNKKQNDIMIASASDESRTVGFDLNGKTCLYSISNSKNSLELYLSKGNYINDVEIIIKKGPNQCIFLVPRVPGTSNIRAW